MADMMVVWMADGSAVMTVAWKVYLRVYLRVVCWENC